MAPVTFGPSFVETTAPATPVGATQKGHSGFFVGQFLQAGTDGAAGTVSANDLLVRVTTLNIETCMALNDLLDVPNDVGIPPTISVSGSIVNYYDYTATYMVTDSRVAGKQGFCTYLSTTPPRGVFWFLLIER